MILGQFSIKKNSSSMKVLRPSEQAMKKQNSEILSLFMVNWESIRDNQVSSVIQLEKGTYHRKADFHEFMQYSPMNLDETIKSYKDKYNL